jgi:hypothetical protein
MYPTDKADPSPHLSSSDKPIAPSTQAGIGGASIEYVPT